MAVSGIQVTPSKHEASMSQAQAGCHMQPLLHWTQKDTPPTLPEHTRGRCKEGATLSPDGRLGAATQLMS